MPREAPGEVAPARVLALELREHRARLVEVAAGGGVEQLELKDVDRGKPAPLADLATTRRGAARLAVAERALDEPAKLDERPVAFLHAHVDDAFPRLALAGHDHDRRTTAPAPVAAFALGGFERRPPPLGQRARSGLEHLAHRFPHARRRDHVRLCGPLFAGRVSR